MKTEKLGGVAGGEGECGDDVAGWLVRERRSLDILQYADRVKNVYCLLCFCPLNIFIHSLCNRRS